MRQTCISTLILSIAVLVLLFPRQATVLAETAGADTQMEIIEDLYSRVVELETRMAQCENSAASCAEPNRRRGPAGDASKTTGLDTLEKRIAALEIFQKEQEKLSPVRRSPRSAWDLRFGGRVFNDWVFPDAESALEDSTGNFSTNTLFRTARLVLKGFARPNFGFKFELDFAEGDPDLTDVFITLPAPGSNKFRFGRQKEPFGFEVNESSRFLTFVERAPVSEVLVPKRNTGMTIYRKRWAPRTGWWLGYFRNANSHGVSEDQGGFNITGRITTNPRWRDNGTDIVHFGLAYSHRETNGGTMEFTGKTGSRLVPPLSDTGELQVDSADVFGFQAGAARGRTMIMGEYACSCLDTRENRDGKLSGAYITLAYNLTGEKHPYDRSSRAFGRLVPGKNYHAGHGGAWQLALRYSFLDLQDTDAAINGGMLREWTFGVNWFLNQNLRIMYNLLLPELDDVGRANINHFRVQVDF